MAIKLNEEKLRKAIKDTLMEVHRFDKSFTNDYTTDADVRYFNRKTNFDGTDFLDPKNNDVWNSIYKIHREISDLEERLCDYGQRVEQNGATEGQLNKLRQLYIKVNKLYECSSEILELYNGGFYFSDDENIPQKNFGNWYTHMNIDPD